MVSTVATERDEMRARLGHAQSFAPEHLTRYAVVPRAAHEAEAVWRVGHDGVDAARLHAAHDVEAVAVVDGHELVGEGATCVGHRAAPPLGQSASP
jgi:hypothetical protein